MEGKLVEDPRESKANILNFNSDNKEEDNIDYLPRRKSSFEHWESNAGIRKLSGEFGLDDEDINPED
jgi:hypothetical protein